MSRMRTASGENGEFGVNIWRAGSECGDARGTVGRVRDGRGQGGAASGCAAMRLGGSRRASVGAARAGERGFGVCVGHGAGIGLA